MVLFYLNCFLPFFLTGHVGAPLPCNLIKLVDVAEKNYFASKGEGEVSRATHKFEFTQSKLYI